LLLRGCHFFLSLWSNGLFAWRLERICLLLVLTWGEYSESFFSQTSLALIPNWICKNRAREVCKRLYLWTEENRALSFKKPEFVALTIQYPVSVKRVQKCFSYTKPKIILSINGSLVELIITWVKSRRLTIMIADDLIYYILLHMITINPSLCIFSTNPQHQKHTYILLKIACI
jgi:hypothetical protein